MAKLTILEVGMVPPNLRGRFGSLPDMFKTMIASHRADIEFAVISVVEGQDLPDIDDVEALLITGSMFGTYDEIPWKKALEDLIRAAHARNLPMVGVCFGHQIIAQALGGVVQRTDKGWGLGRHVYQVRPDNGLIDASEVAIACSHQDQVLVPPSDAITVLSSAFTPCAGLLYDNGSTFTLQAHPEFERDYSYALCEMRQGIATDDVVRKGKRSLNQPLDNHIIGKAIARFLAESGLPGRR
ncbi:gamma-glutamyl-gamma-aminobutyrate hydrolase family protein (plasmid) [Shinella sp. H4-D48]|uniref:glutamine amidotransferase-related protein n=1 Tax=Shinella sp. H4-D48 TaxID=2925841 RepID=UPI001F52B84F|nr:gamma-glutamyl-gamma-aminobutyrate hydrolase family protein [Shinella sp. H4-D48]UNK39965.1 gamma-glutamyl-gamma-aminobutyrate hydrolase family protein [Shinella sp. H4-D48]